MSTFRIALLTLAVAGAAMTPSPEARADAVLTVTTLVDENVDPGAGCSLREAMMSAQANANKGGCVAVGAYGDEQIKVP